MGNDEKIRVTKGFKHHIDELRAKCLLNGIKCPSRTIIIEVVDKKIDWEKLWQDEFNEV